MNSEEVKQVFEKISEICEHYNIKYKVSDNQIQFRDKYFMSIEYRSPVITTNNLTYINHNIHFLYSDIRRSFTFYENAEKYLDIFEKNMDNISSIKYGLFTVVYYIKIKGYMYSVRLTGDDEIKFDDAYVYMFYKYASSPMVLETVNRYFQLETEKKVFEQEYYEKRAEIISIDKNALKLDYKLGLLC